MILKKHCHNGVRIVHEHMPEARSVSIGVWVQAGSNDELVGEEGLAHFIEHMLFKGTETETAKSIAEQFDRMGGELNAFTSKEATCYHTTVLAEDGKQAIYLLADMLFNSTFLEEEMMKEKSVILEEIAMCEDAADDEIHEQLWKTMYPNHPLGRAVLGRRDSVIHFTKDAVENFMTRLYRPERIVLSLAGNYDEALLTYMHELFESFTRSGKIDQASTIALPVFQANTSVVEKEIEQAHVCIGFPSIPLQDPRQYELAMMDSIIGGAMSSRLFQEVREKQGLAYSIYSYFSSYETGGAFVIYGGTAPEKLKTLEQTIQNVLADAVEKGISEQELAHAKQSVKSSFLLGLESVESRMMRNGHQELLLKRHRSVEEVIQKINEIEGSAVEKMMKDTFSQKYARAIIQPK